MSYKAIIAGASGLIGSELVNILLKQPEYSELVLLVRKRLSLEHEKIKQVVVDYEQLTVYAEYIKGHALFCCLGSTQKKTPDLSIYRKVDHDYPLQLAQLALENGVHQYHLVSALGANSSSSNFYTRMKGETESDIKKVGLKNLHIYQPSLLTGNRQEYRPVEKIASIVMRLIDPLLLGKWSRYRSIRAKTVAMAMFKTSLKNKDGVFVHPSDEIKILA